MAGVTPDVVKRVEELARISNQRGWTVGFAESCTGGLIAGLLTEIPGSSDVVDRGFVTYSNEAKAQMLGVDSQLIAVHGAVSEQVARAMATGALSHAMADITVAVTGVAGPGGGSAEKPVGLVHFGASRRGRGVIHQQVRFGDISRSAIRIASVRQALAMLRSLAEL